MRGLINVIDIGTGSTKASLFECGETTCEQVAFKSVDVRIGGEISAKIGEDRRDAAVEVVENLLSFGQKNGAESAICVATYALRSAKNAREFLLKIRAETGLDVHVLSGLEEARLVGNSVKNMEKIEKFFSLDVGGGSVEFNLFNGAHIFSASRDIGAINLANILCCNHLKPSIENITNIVRKSMENIPLPTKDDKIICTGGCLAIGKRFLAMADAKNVSAAAVESLFHRISPMGTGERLAFGIPRGKVDIFDIALAIVIATLSCVKRGEVLISDASVRHGVAINRALFSN
ncbi:MAG: hypothetical protein LBJ94_00350 [Puniceicoccales bacterium]|jgi:exopolyphosphatase/guanosine-5'-triphosphate,3'-diphosphate pyrophosphatase|nr:hypothetical protein [Puniceicoccales bacterium]